jgi:O-antigen/teichoic acid export membrane protein
MSSDTARDRQLAVNGTIWTIAGYGTTQVLRLLSNLVLARLLAPEHFGMMALVTVFIQGLGMLSDIGLNASIVQSKRGESESLLRAAWTLQVIRGVLLCIIIFIAAAPVSQLYSTSPEDAILLRNVLWAVAASALVAGFSSTSIALFQRRIHLSSTILLELVPQLISILVMIGAALQKPSVWALVYGWWAYSACRVIFSHLMAERRDRFGWDRDCIRELFTFGRWILLSTALAFLAANIDKLILGKLLTLTELGLYAIALTFAKVAIDIASRLSGYVVFPLLAKHRDDIRNMVMLCLKGRQIVLLVSGAAATSFCLGAPLFFEALYDPQYHGAGSIAQFLCVYVWAWTLVATIDRIPLALGKPRVLFGANLIMTICMVCAAGGYPLYGLRGFICGMAVAQVGGLLYVVKKLPCGRSDCLRQSVRYTAIYFCYTGAALSLQALFRDFGLVSRACCAALLILPPNLIALVHVDRHLHIRQRVMPYLRRLSTSSPETIAEEESSHA